MAARREGLAGQLEAVAVQTDLDYPMRNVHQISKSVGLIVITGGDGALEEILPAIADYDLPSAPSADQARPRSPSRTLVQIFPEWASNVLIADDPDDLVTFVLEQTRRRTAAEVG